MANQLHILFDPQKGQMTLTVNKESVSVVDFLTDKNGMHVVTLDESAQKQIALFILSNILQ